MNDDDDTPLPSTEEEVSENVYDWSDPERNDYDSDDSFLAPDNEEDDEDDASDDNDDEVAVLSPRTLAEMERRGRPRRSTRPPVRYSPPVDDSDGERYSYDCVGADDDGQSEVAPEDADDDDESVYNPNNGGDSSEEEDDDDDGDGGEDVDDEGIPSPRGVKRKKAHESPELVLEQVAEQRHRHDQPENPSTDG